jgi:hypothetical protein
MKQVRLHLIASATLCGALFGCSPWVADKVEILVGTTPPGASCLVSRAGQPIATVEPTPAIALLDPAAGDLTGACRRHGFQDVAVVLPPAQIASSSNWFTSPAPVEYQRRVEIALVPR